MISSAFQGAETTLLGERLRHWGTRDEGWAASVQHAWSRSFDDRRLERSDALFRYLTENLVVTHRLDAAVALVEGGLEPVLGRLVESAVVVADPTGLAAFQARYRDFDPGGGLAFVESDALEDPGHMSSLAGALTKFDDGRVVALGGGRVMDLAKFLGHLADRPVVAIPTSLATHVYASPKTHALPVVRTFGYTRTLDGRAPDVALLDVPFLERVGQSERRLLIGGIGDLLAFLTAPLDWRLAEAAGRGRTDPFVLSVTDEILDWLEGIDPSRRLREWVEPYALAQVCLCHMTDWVGSAPASGSEHLFAHGADRVASPTGLHGELVALGALAMSPLLDGDVGRARSMLARFGLPRSLAGVGLTPTDAALAVLDGRDEGREKHRYTVIEKLEWDRGRWEEFFRGLDHDQEEGSVVRADS